MSSGPRWAITGGLVGRNKPGTKRTWEFLQEKIRVPTFALGAALGGCVDSRLCDAVMREEGFPRGFHGVRVEGEGYFLQRERQGAINRTLVDWLRGTGRKALR